MTTLLLPTEPAPLEVYNPDGQGRFVLICEHAGRLIPQRLGQLGLPTEELTRHIAWDIGAKNVAEALSTALDAPLFMQRYSRLVCDCNRRPDVETYIPTRSENTDIPGNFDLNPPEIAQRTQEIHAPFHDHISKVLDQRLALGQQTILVTIHSFTPIFKDVPRPWQIGVLYNRDPVFSRRVLELLRAKTTYCVGDNQPYSVSDDSDYAIPVHGEARGLACVEIELRNDLTEGAENAQHWAALLSQILTEAAVGL